MAKALSKQYDQLNGPCQYPIRINVWPERRGPVGSGLSTSAGTTQLLLLLGGDICVQRVKAEVELQRIQPFWLFRVVVLDTRGDKHFKGASISN